VSTGVILGSRRAGPTLARRSGTPLSASTADQDDVGLRERNRRVGDEQEKREQSETRTHEKRWCQQRYRGSLDPSSHSRLIA
jgi:hypothetical protein